MEIYIDKRYILICFMCNKMHLDWNSAFLSPWVRNILIQRVTLNYSALIVFLTWWQPCDVALAGRYREISQLVYSRKDILIRASCHVDGACVARMDMNVVLARVVVGSRDTVYLVHESLEWVSEGSHAKQIKMHIYAVGPSDILDIQFAIS